jgi:hypothetical protein
MLKIAAHVSKKVPLPDRQYSSQQFGASLEMEVSDAQSADEVQERLRRLYAMISRSIDEQIAKVQPPVGQPTTAPSAPRTATATAVGTGAKPTGATQAQQRAIFALCKSKGLVLAETVGRFGASDVSNLSLKDASRLIDQLKKSAAS